MNLIFKKSCELYLKCILSTRRPIKISYTGGLGNQILSLLAQRYLEFIGSEVSAQMNYFLDNKYRNRLINKSLSVYEWELENYMDLSIDMLMVESKSKDKSIKISDGFFKLYLAMEGAKNDFIVNNIKLKDYPINFSNGINLESPYTCIHLRRGDYLKVASHIVSTSEVIKASSKFTNICESLIVISDSDLNELDKNLIYSVGYKNVIPIISGDPLEAHQLMRNSKVLITSNSQFSFSAAIFSSAIVLIPKKWYSGLRHYPLQALLSSYTSDFNLW